MRRAFTLVEMLVVIAIIIALAAITLAFLPRREVKLAADGAAQLQTYIASAKSRAMRDAAPRGVRLLTTDGGASFRELQYIEVPEPYAPGLTARIRRNGQWVYFADDTIEGAVMPGDLFEITGDTNSPHRVDVVQANPPGGPAGSWGVHLVSVPSVVQGGRGWSDTQNYRFTRQARPLLGEPPLQLPSTVLIDGKLSLNLPTSWDGTATDIIFSPSGQVINALGGRVVLWVRDDNNVSAPTLLCVYANTGGVAAQPMNPWNPALPYDVNTNNPYKYTQDMKAGQ